MDKSALQNTPENAPRPKLFGPDNKLLDLDELDLDHPESPFDDTPINKVVEFLKKHGIALAKVVFMIGTGAATFIGGWSAATSGEEVIWAIALMVWGCGFIHECLFAYSWVKKGSYELAGMQLTILDRVHNYSSIAMLGALICMLLEHQTNNELVHYLFIGWTSIAEPLLAVWLMHSLYIMKGAHPVSRMRPVKCIL